MNVFTNIVFKLMLAHASYLFVFVSVDKEPATANSAPVLLEAVY